MKSRIILWESRMHDTKQAQRRRQHTKETRHHHSSRTWCVQFIAQYYMNILNVKIVFYDNKAASGTHPYGVK